ncbi:MAG TPA: PfkB family carbohydrate kinase [Ornithinibacter sp.]|nr:PfkB family carbohydrate kinase [Ornithinibacter sp.]
MPDGRVLACGLATLDVVQVVERMPGANEKVVALSTRVEAGGPALNAAVTAALLGMPSRLATALGRSPLAEVVREDCAAHGVELVDVAAEGFEVPVSSVLVTESTGERAVVSRNAVGVSSWASVDVVSVLDGVSAVLVDGHHLPVAVAVAAAAREHGIPVLADAGSWKPGLEALLAHVDVLVASADLRVPHGGSDLACLLALGPTWVARSAGADPVRWLSADGSSGSVAVPIVGVVDTLGAGDVLHGTFVADLARHGTADLPGTLTRAVAVAARSVGASGVRGWAPVSTRLSGPRRP